MTESLDDYREKMKSQSLQTLENILSHIDRERYPERYQVVLEEIQVRRKDPVAVAAASPKNMIAGFWIRLLSDFIDVLVLGFMGWVSVLFMRDFFYELGESGWWIGLLVAFLYASLLQTSLGNGQTIAKKMLGIQVIKQDGAFMSFPESLFRYSVVAFIAYHGFIEQGLSVLFPGGLGNYFQIAYTLLVWFVVCGVVLVVPFHPLKQGLHDLLVGTVVVRKGLFSPEKIYSMRNERKSKRAYLIAAAGFLCAIVLTTFTYWKFFSAEPLNQVSEIARTIEKATEFRNTGVGVNLHWNPGEEKQNSVVVVAYIPKKQFDDERLLKREAQKAVDIVVKEFPNVKDYDFIWVQARTGFNIGITSLNENHGFVFSVEGKEIQDLPPPIPA